MTIPTAAHQIHPIPPVWNEDSRILILGSFPSVASRAGEFFYGHPQNRFWHVLAALFSTSIPQTIAEKKALLLDHRIALWDVLASCKITGSADASITDAHPTDLTPILHTAPIELIVLNGKTALRYFRTFYPSFSTYQVVCLPSTSPANAAFSLDRLIEAWRVISHSQTE